ncbi:MAG: phosphomannomutase/phosphoglucomutase [Ornithinimicrobium sp.]|uniref:phosphomannomutase/phosphoglucomutase n=1 Tax=Ornithinimicrobium sp. TaxID=1977084 RepID=UPI0026E015AA|nr:phosphomannomutase/phosphoglucomutase [Ornithinimicrobium sp.]MDO5739567.1 phosphomannomutase/phosphoglucomutase [Ornithinimicrobium sp.]
MTAARLADFVKAYDVRGLVPEQFNAEVASALGSAFAQVVVLPEGETGIVIGHDMRPSSPELSQAFAAAAAAHGLDVTMIGLCSTDGLYYASGVLQRPGAMFTASHNPANYNGIKLCRAGARPVGVDSGLAEVRDLAQWILDRGAAHDGLRSTAPAAGAITQADLLTDYASYLHSLVDLRDIRPLTVVVDAGNGMAGHTVPAVLGEAACLPLRVIPLYFELDGSFPNHEANPLEPANLRDLQAAVLQHDADLGLAFDGDADRCFVIDERGLPVSSSALTALVAAREIARDVASGTSPADIAVVHNLICSRAVRETIEELGARPVRTRVGHSYIKAQMAEHEAVFGGEHSGHYYFRDFWFADTGMLAALHVLAALGEQPRPLSELVGRYQRYDASGEINSTVADVIEATERVRRWAQQQGATADTLDGLTMTHEATRTTPMWWFSLRPSNTEPLLRLNVEAADPSTMEQVRDTVLALVRQEAT